jgi:hypothetical protein
MKTLIISGTVAEKSKKSPKYIYNVMLYGQTSENPLCVCITQKYIQCNGYNDLIDECKNIYCKYFNTDDFNTERS